MGDSKYIVVLVLAAICLSLTAFGQSGMVQGHAAGIGEKAFTMVKAISHPGINLNAVIMRSGYMRPRASRDLCIRSCLASFPNRNSFQFRACANGCR